MSAPILPDDPLLRAMAPRRAVGEFLAQDLSAFCKGAWPIIDCAELAWNWHHGLMCEYLMLARQRQIKRLAIAVPPRSLKSKIVSCLFPAWCWTVAPHESFLCASWSSSFSTELSIIRRSLLTSRWYSNLWPGVVQLRPDANRVDDYSNLAHGRMIATGMDNVVGRGADYIIVDDPMTPREAYSELERASAIRAFTGGLRSRLNDPQNGVIVVIQQRLHRGDLIGMLKESPEAGDWTFLSLPMVAPTDQTITFPVSGLVKQRAKGELLQATRWSQQWCEREAESDPYVWAAQYQQCPTDPANSILRPEHFKYWVHRGTEAKPEGALLLPDNFDKVIIAGDLAFTSSEASDRVCLGVWGQKGAFKYLLDFVWRRLDFTETVDAIRDLVQRFPDYHKIYVEKAANAAAVISELENEIPGIEGVRPSGSKIARYHAVSGHLARGEVVLPHPTYENRTREFVDECALAGIGGRFDDAADMTALAVSQMAVPHRPERRFWADRVDRFRAQREYIDGTAGQYIYIDDTDEFPNGELPVKDPVDIYLDEILGNSSDDDQ